MATYVIQYASHKIDGFLRRVDQLLLGGFNWFEVDFENERRDQLRRREETKEASRRTCNSPSNRPCSNLIALPPAEIVFNVPRQASSAIREVLTTDRDLIAACNEELRVADQGWRKWVLKSRSVCVQSAVCSSDSAR